MKYWAEDVAGNREDAHVLDVNVDKTAPAISGLRDDCELWPPNGRMVRVADVATEEGAELSVSASGDADDVVIDGPAVWLRARKDPHGESRSYAITATATDVAGNATTETATCTAL